MAEEKHRDRIIETMPGKDPEQCRIHLLNRASPGTLPRKTYRAKWVIDRRDHVRG